jgi:hypothetical protein
MNDDTFGDFYVAAARPLPRCSVCGAESLTELMDATTFDERVRVEIPIGRCPNGPHEARRG